LFDCFRAWLLLPLRLFGFETARQSIASINRELEEKAPAPVAA
jgi:hypothetical protein